MPQLLTEILMEITSAWRFRWAGAIVAWVVCLLGWTWIAIQPDAYQATAVVYVDTSSVLQPILDDRIVSTDVETQLSYVRQALLGREHLERVVRENSLGATAATDREREEVIERLRTTIGISSPVVGRGNGSTYTITYQDASREGSVNIVTTLLNSLVEDTLGANRHNADTAERFLDDRILEYENRLRQAEQARADFQRVNAGRLSGDTAGYFERMETARTELEEQQRELRLATARRDRLREQLSGDAPVTPFAFGAAPTGTNAEIGAIDARIATQREQLDQLLLDYTDKHPDVVAVREVLGRLEAQRAEQQALLAANPQAVVSTVSSNPVYQEVQIRLNETEVEIAELETGIAERTTSLTSLKSLMDELPEVEAALTRLNRDYEVIYEQYQALVRSRETQDLSRKAQDTDQVEFRVINPPLAGFRPVAPQRLVLLSGVFMAALVAGGALCWLLAQLRPVFSETRSLRDITGLPVLGAVYRVVAPGSTLWRRHVGLVSFATTMGVLTVLYAGAIAVETIGPGMHSLVGN